MSVTSTTASDPASDPGTATVAELVNRLSSDVGTLVQCQVELAKGELAAAAKHAGIGAGLFSGAGLLAVTAWLLLSVAFAELLTGTGLAVGWCFLIVGCGYLLIAGGLGLLGKSQLGRVEKPARTLASVKDDLSLVKERSSRG
jgi:hypothetical protein